MKPFLICGGSSKSRKDWAKGLSSRNGWNLYEPDKKRIIAELHKDSVTSNISRTPNIIYVTNAETLSVSDLEKLFGLIKDSPHRIVLGVHSLYKFPKGLRKKCHFIKVGESQDSNFFKALNSIMTESDREKVRRMLVTEKKSVEVFFHILKNNIWKTDNPQAFKAIESGLLNFYKVDKDFLVSILAYCFPVCKIPLTYDRKRKVYKEEANILKKMRKRMRLSELEAIQTYEAITTLLKRSPPNFAQAFVADLDLTKKEQQFLKIPTGAGTGKKMKPSTLPHRPPKKSSLNRWM